MMKKQVNTIATAAMVFSLSAAWAQGPTAPATSPGMDGVDAGSGRSKKAGEMEAMPGMDHSDVHGRTSAAEDRMSGAAQMNHGSAPSEKAGGMGNMDHGGGMGQGSMQSGSAPPDARDPHAYSGGYDFGPTRQLRLADEHNFSSLLVDRLEGVRTRDNWSTAYDLQARFGRDYDRVVLKAEGEIDDGKLQDAHTDLLWGHAVAAYWDTQLGVRYDSGVGPDRGWLAFGVQGLAPYWFNVEAAAYVGAQGRTALRLRAEYDLLFTQKLILTPRIETNLYGKRDPENELGSGLSDYSLGVRLRYEIRREFAPYIGIERFSLFGATADYARAAGGDAKETRLVAGLRFWY